MRAHRLSKGPILLLTNVLQAQASLSRKSELALSTQARISYAVISHVWLPRTLKRDVENTVEVEVT